MICPTGKSANGRQVIFSDFPKIILYAPDQITSISFAIHPTEGRIAIVTDAGLDAVDATASGAQGRSQGEMNLVSDVRHADDRR
jgi:hypothetical protein